MSDEKNLDDIFVEIKNAEARIINAVKTHTASILQQNSHDKTWIRNAITHLTIEERLTLTKASHLYDKLFEFDKKVVELEEKNLALLNDVLRAIAEARKEKPDQWVSERESSR
jgi:hypothetical protein